MNTDYKETYFEISSVIGLELFSKKMAGKVKDIYKWGQKQNY